MIWSAEWGSTAPSEASNARSCSTASSATCSAGFPRSPRPMNVAGCSFMLGDERQSHARRRAVPFDGLELSGDARRRKLLLGSLEHALGDPARKLGAAGDRADANEWSARR